MVEQVLNTGCKMLISSFIFLAETHGFLDDFKKEKELIEKYSPDYVLAEKMENIKLSNEWDYFKFFKRKKLSKMTKYNEVYELVKLCHKKNIPLIGIDFKNYGFNSYFQEIIQGEKEPSKKDENQIKTIIKKRQKHHLNKLKNYPGKILVLLGSWHLREDSYLCKNLDNYTIIYPSDSQGRMILGPGEIKKEDIKYSERTSNVKS